MLTKERQKDFSEKQIKNFQNPFTLKSYKST